MVKRRSLAEELADLACPAPTRELRVDDGDEFAPILGESDVEEPTAELLPSSKRRRRENSAHLALKGDVQLDGTQYVGRPTTRKAALSEGVFPEARMEKSEDEIARPVDILHSGSFDTDLQDHGAQPQLAMPHQDEESLENPSSSEHTDRAKALQVLYRCKHDEQQKGEGVQRQMMWWEQWLGVRIVLQKCISWANRIPPSPTHLPWPAEASSTGDSMKLLAKECKSVLADLLDLDGELLMCCPHSVTMTKAIPCPAISNETGLTDIWDFLSHRYNTWCNFKRTSLDRFYQQAFLQTGSSVQKSNLTVLQQGASTQIDNLMRIPHKLLQRSQVPWRGHPPMLGGEPAAGETGLINDSENGHGVEARDCESFDDHEFYQQLLEGFLEGKGGDAAAAHTVEKGHRRGAHTNNTKDRKLRYHIQDKLVNFMVPDSSEPGSFADQLIAHLFGRGTL